MNKSIRIFKSIKEQEEYHQQLMLHSSVADRFRKLYQMQQMNSLLHPVVDKVRKIHIGKWIS
jgi:hypothetical protein